MRGAGARPKMCNLLKGVRLAAGDSKPPVGDNGWKRLKTLWERLGESLFHVPFVFMAMAVALAQAMVALDAALSTSRLPAVLDSTVDSGRVLLSVIAGGTITAASVVFSLTLVAVQLASTQFSPRTLGSFLGDRGQQVIIGLVLGTFVYCLLVLRVVRGPLEDGGTQFVPRFSVLVALTLGVMAMVAVIASINRTAQSLRVESVVRKVTEETMAAIGRQYDELPDQPNTTPGEGRSDGPPEPPQNALVVGAPMSGWIQDIHAERIAGVLPEGSSGMVHQAVGSFVVSGQRIVSVWPPPPDDAAVMRLAAAFVVGEQRSRQADVDFGITKLVDIAARSLSPGVNDPKTAEETVLHLGQVLTELAGRRFPPAVSVVDGRTIIRVAEPAYADYVDTAIEPIRRFARSDPLVLSTVIRTLATVRDVVDRRRPGTSPAALATQVELIVEESPQLLTSAEAARVIQTAVDTGFLPPGHVVDGV